MKINHYSTVLNSPLSKIGIIMQGSAIAALDFVADDIPLISNTETAHIEAELASYFNNPTHRFSLPLTPTGTPFQQRVWRALSEIPHGTTVTYGELAKQLRTSPRAIGQACRRNPVPVIVPCHRVVAANHVGGYAGEESGKLFEIKNWLLQHERM